MLGRLGACVLAQIPRLRALLLHNICLFGAGLSAVFIPLCNDYITMSITAFGYGLFMGMCDPIVATPDTFISASRKFHTFWFPRLISYLNIRDLGFTPL